MTCKCFIFSCVLSVTVTVIKQKQDLMLLFSCHFYTDFVLLSMSVFFVIVGGTLHSIKNYYQCC